MSGRHSRQVGDPSVRQRHCSVGSLPNIGLQPTAVGAIMSRRG